MNEYLFPYYVKLIHFKNESPNESEGISTLICFAVAPCSALLANAYLFYDIDSIVSKHETKREKRYIESRESQLEREVFSGSITKLFALRKFSELSGIQEVKKRNHDPAYYQNRMRWNGLVEPLLLKDCFFFDTLTDLERYRFKEHLIQLPQATQSKIYKALNFCSSDVYKCFFGFNQQINDFLYIFDIVLNTKTKKDFDFAANEKVSLESRMKAE